MTIRILIIVFFLMTFVHSVSAIYDPIGVSNNKYGIHVADINDLSDAANLVNSSGGQWGYVTFVLADNDRDLGKWQKIFTSFNTLKLIPIVRLATHVVGSSWIKPQSVDAEATANFLSDLPWPTKNRYVVLFNEPNHAKEWGDTIDPEDYARTAYSYASALKSKSNDFFILPAGFDASASNTALTLDEQDFILRIFNEKPEFFTMIDGWTSHSYPNPGFSGSPYAKGRGSLKTFDWELTLLKNLGLPKEYPVFITETGWAHTGVSKSHSRLQPDQVAEYIDIADQIVWNDSRIVAVTPFLFQYPENLFSMFSWLIPLERTPYSFYLRYQKIPKFKGEPIVPPSFEYIALLSEPLSL